MAKEVIVGRLYGFESVQFTKQETGELVNLQRCYFDYQHPRIKGYGTGNCFVHSNRFSSDRLELGCNCYLVVDGIKCDYAGRAPAPAGK